MVPAILQVHQQFLDELRSRLEIWEPLQRVGDAFVQVVSVGETDFVLLFVVFTPSKLIYFIFISHISFLIQFSSSTVLETYTLFVNNVNRAKTVIRTTSHQRPAFARFLETMAREHKGKLTLDNLLIKPVQKFPK